MWVIKVGGSLLSSGRLNEWLEIMVKYGAGKILIVPGGGIFADQVRTAQQKWKFDDKTAHQMALLAMEQYAHVLRSYAPDLVLADSIETIQKLVSKKKIPVCLPFKMIDQCQDLPTNWDLTSDSIALWLAEQINAKHTVLLKSLNLDMPNSVDLKVKQLADADMVDKVFPDFVRKSTSNVWWLDKDDTKALEILLKTESNPEGVLKRIVY